MTTLRAALDEVERHLSDAAETLPKAKREGRIAFMKSEMSMLGLTVPMVRRELARGFSFGAPEFEASFKIWDHVWRRARLHEAKLVAVFWLDRVKADVEPETLWPLVRPWTKGIRCWDMSDTLSGVYAHLHEAAPETVYPDLAAWNASPAPWERRQSLVSLFFYTRVRKRVPPLARVLPLVEARLADPDYYVQKGVGWCLRECLAAYPDATYAFIETHAADLAPAAWQAATEKLSKTQKATVKAIRQRRC